MNNKLSSLLLAAVCAGGISAHAQQAPAPVETPSYSITATPSFVSQYMFRGVRLGGASFQPSAEFDTANWGLGVWTNFPMKDKVDGVSDPEIDGYGFYTITVNENLSVVPGFTWYNYPDAEKKDGFYKSTFEPSLAVNYTIAGVKITPKFYYDIVLDGPTYELTAAYALPLKDIGTELDFTATVGTYIWRDYAEDTAPKMKNWGDYWLLGVSVPYAVTQNSKVVVGFAYTKGSGNYIKQGTDHKFKNEAAVGRGVVTVSYAYTF